MNQIKQLLQMHKDGDGKKTIARKLCISKTTVKEYLNKIKALNCDLDELLAMDEPILEAKLHAGNPAYKDNDRYNYIKTRLDYFEKELKKTGVTRQLLWEEYRSYYPDGYGYTQFCFHLKQQLIARNPTMVLNHKPGEKLFIDFAGKMMSYIDKETGEVIECPVFIACLPYSDYGFAIAVRSQQIPEFLYALRRCLEHLGGCVEIVVPDNLKSAVAKANKYEPNINRVMEDFANYYGFTVIPARSGKPQDKALVEDQVKLFYSRVMAKLRNDVFFDLDSLNKAIAEKMLAHNQTRMQQKLYCREEKFLADEKPLLKPLPQDPFEIRYYKEYKVAKNNHINLTQDKHYYSVPYKWIGQMAKVIYTRSIVKIYIKGELVAVHPRDMRPGKYSTIKEHLCSHHQQYLDRSPDYYKNRAKNVSPRFYKVVETLFNGGRPPEQNYKSCDGLFSLYRKTNPEIFDRACEIALESRSCSYRFMMKIIENLKKQPQIQPKENNKPLPDHENIRGADYYKQTTLNFKSDESN